MPPTKILIEQQKIQQKTITTKTTSKVLTRSQASFQNVYQKAKMFTTKDMSKRKADQLSPPKGTITKRSALLERNSNITTTKPTNLGEKKPALKKPVVPVGNNVKQKDVTKITTTITQPKIPVYVDLKSILTTKSEKKSRVADLIQVQPFFSSALQSGSSKLSVVFWNKMMPVFIALKQAYHTPFLKSPLSQKSLSAGAQNNENVDPNAKKQGKQVVAHIETVEIKSTEVKYDSIQKVTSSGKLVTKFRQSLDANQDKTDESFYTTALEDVVPESDESSKIISPVKKSGEKESKSKEVSSPKVPQGVEDFDKENILDPIQVSDYAMDIFDYMKRREKCFLVEDYMPRQVVITKWMRALLVDWMVDVQENFELNHETLYLGVKITDLYLDKVVVAKEILQLVGAASLFLAAKYEERMPPLIEDFIYICENAFTREDMLKMEMNVLKVIDFNLGIPLSYRFLRRFARCCKATMPTLTLARYILELSLMEYHMIFYSESKIASATLYMALMMKNVSGWTPTLEYYSGYKLSEFMPIVLDLNAMLHRKPKEQLKIVRNKYSHKIFFEVAKTPLIDDEELQYGTTTENKENKENL